MNSKLSKSPKKSGRNGPCRYDGALMDVTAVASGVYP
jgi:hypothetical protein